MAESYKKEFKQNLVKKGSMKDVKFQLSHTYK